MAAAGQTVMLTEHCFNEYTLWLSNVVYHQQSAETEVERFLDKLIEKALTPLDAIQCFPFNTERVDLRGNGLAVPNSPLQIVVKLPLRNDLKCFGAPDVREFLGLMLTLFRNEPNLSVNAVMDNNTIGLTYAGLVVEFTAIYWTQWWSHLPRLMSVSVAEVLRVLPRHVTLLAIIIVDWANTIVHLTGNLKGIHWILLLIAWWRHTLPDHNLPLATLFANCLFFCQDWNLTT